MDVTEIMKQIDPNPPGKYRELTLEEIEEQHEAVLQHELDRQLYQHILLIGEKLNLSRFEAGKLFDLSAEEVESLRFNAFVLDELDKTAKEFKERRAAKNNTSPTSDQERSPENQ